MILKEALWQALKGVPFPGFEGRNVVGSVREMEVDAEGRVRVALGLAHMAADVRESLSEAVAAALYEVDGVQEVQIRVVQMGRAAAPAAPQPVVISNVLAVGSGKGGVGKSTLSVNIAVALAELGYRVGLLDADVFGPNVPRMLGVESLPSRAPGEPIQPAVAHGVAFVSVGLLVDTERAVIWRGPMTDKILRQFLQQVAWGTLDVLIVDLPPGTGDIAISLARHARPDGAIVVVTPQGVAVDDGRKAASMFERLEVPLLGVVENMSFFICDECATRHRLFGEGGGAALAADLNVPLLGQVPMESHVRAGGDEGAPAVLRPDSGAGRALQEIAVRVVERLQLGEPVPTAPS